MKNLLRGTSGFLVYVATLPPLLVSFPIGAVLGVVSNRAMTVVMAVCGIIWLPIGGPAWLLSMAIDKYIGDDKKKPS